MFRTRIVYFSNLLRLKANNFFFILTVIWSWNSCDHYILETINMVVWELTSHKSYNRHMFVAMQRLVDFVSMVTQQYVTTQQLFNGLLAGFSVGRSIRNSPLLCNGHLSVVALVGSKFQQLLCWETEKESVLLNWKADSISLRQWLRWKQMKEIVTSSNNQYPTLCRYYEHHIENGASNKLSIVSPVFSYQPWRIHTGHHKPVCLHYLTNLRNLVVNLLVMSKQTLMVPKLLVCMWA
jgi:hypothetical protein